MTAKKCLVGKKKIVEKIDYQKKEKKAKGEILDSGYLVSITMVYARFWDLGD